MQMVGKWQDVVLSTPEGDIRASVLPVFDSWGERRAIGVRLDEVPPHWSHENAHRAVKSAVADGRIRCSR